jgi:hypothetical protein
MRRWNSLSSERTFTQPQLLPGTCLTLSFIAVTRHSNENNSDKIRPIERVQEVAIPTISFVPTTVLYLWYQLFCSNPEVSRCRVFCRKLELLEVLLLLVLEMCANCRSFLQSWHIDVHHRFKIYI